MVSINITLPDMVYELVLETMEKEKMNRSNAVAYLIKIGYHYRYNILGKEKPKPLGASEASEGSGPSS